LKTPDGELDSLLEGNQRRSLEAALPPFFPAFPLVCRQARENPGGASGWMRLKFETAAPWRILVVEVDYLEGEPGDQFGSGLLCCRNPVRRDWRGGVLEPSSGVIAGGLGFGRGERSRGVDPGLPPGSLWTMVCLPRSKFSVTSRAAPFAVVGSRAVIKLFRQLWEENPELEICRILTQRSYSGSPALLGGLQYHQPDGRIHTLAVMHEFIANEGSGWSYTLDQIGCCLETEFPFYLDAIESLGKRTGELHLALAAGFPPEPFTRLLISTTSPWRRRPRLGRR